MCFCTRFCSISFLLFGFGFLLLLLRNGFILHPWLAWNSLHGQGWPQMQQAACLCFQGAGIKSTPQLASIFFNPSANVEHKSFKKIQVYKT